MGRTDSGLPGVMGATAAEAARPLITFTSNRFQLDLFIDYGFGGNELMCRLGR